MYDLVIIGGGPGGLSAAIYALRAKLNTLLLEKVGIGGQIALSDVIENYPGFKTLTGSELMAKMEEHARCFGLETKMSQVEAIRDKENVKIVVTDSGEIECKAVIIASGASPSLLGVKGEDTFSGKGVSYCATCDGPFYSGKEVVVVGGGDTAVKEGIFLTKIAKRVIVVHRRDRFRAEKILQEKILSNSKVEFRWNSALEEICGDESGVTGVKIKGINDSDIQEIKSDGVFIFVGIKPNADFVDIDKDNGGFIIVNEKMETSVKGIFAVGDIRNTPLRQVATAVGDGAIAAVMAEEYISLLEGKSYPSR